LCRTAAEAETFGLNEGEEGKVFSPEEQKEQIKRIIELNQKSQKHKQKQK
jgi:hypothetical protein